MKKFVIKSLIFALSFLAMAYVTDEITSDSLRKSKQGYFGVWNVLLTGKINADIVINGSSRAWVQIDPAVLERQFHKRTYNIGIDAYAFHMQYCRYLLLVQRSKIPKTIIQVLDYSIFNKAEYLYYPDQFFPYLSDSTINKCISEYKGISRLDQMIPFFRYRGKTQLFSHAAKILLRPDLNEPDRYNGFQAQNFPWNDDLEKAKLSFPNYHEPVDSSVVNLFRKYIEDCQHRGIKLIFVYPPDYIEGQDFVKNRKDIFALFERIAKHYQIPYYDYSNHPMAMERKYFYNTEHLNASGSELFTRIFCADLRSIIGDERPKPK
jgi:hypothetical protein